MNIMGLKLTDREKDALRMLASLGNAYHLLRTEAATLLACGLVESKGDGTLIVTDDGRKYLRECDIELARFEPRANNSTNK